MFISPANVSSKVKTNGNVYLICKQFEKTIFMLLIVLIAVTMFSNFEEGFSLITPKLHRLMFI